MSSFTKPLVVRYIDGTKWEVMHQFTYHIGDKTAKEVVVVPKGFITDFASIPRIMWPLIGPPTGEHGKAAVVHDYLYGKHRFTRAKSDRVFREAMKVSDIGWMKRNTMYLGVRLFGWYAWKKGGRR